MKKKYLFGKRGFAGMSPEKQKSIASKGGIKAHELGRGYEWDSKSAREAGLKSAKSFADKKKRLLKK